MTLEGEYYYQAKPLLRAIFVVAILMTLEGEYYKLQRDLSPLHHVVAILMTLEGEYYEEIKSNATNAYASQSS